MDNEQFTNTIRIIISQKLINDIIFISLRSQVISSKRLTRQIMARTKQCARKSVVTYFPVRNLPHWGTSNQGQTNFSSQSQENDKSKDINTQLFSVKFDNQKECEAKAIHFQVYQCSKCGAYLNSQSVLVEKKARRTRKRNMTDEENQIYRAELGKEWECEFCKNVNPLPADFESLPGQNQCYLLQKPDKSQNNEKDNKESLLLYCIDISGSMDMKFQGKSRLEAVKEAIRDQLKRMKFQKEKTKVGIVTFGSKVSVLTGKQTTNIPQNYYNNFESIVEQSKKLTNFSFSLIKSFKDLENFVADLSTYGSTALGPGLLATIQLASTGRKGSKIILCTDGQANIGLNGPEFYTKAAEYAKQKGVVVNILSIKGDRCNLKELGKLTLSTGGSILKIDPTLLGTEFNKISKEEILGCESVLKIIVNKMFEIQRRDGELSKDRTTLTQNYGSFSADTQLTFNFRTLSKEQAAAKGVIYDLFANKKVPMQIQLTYTTPSGAKYLQVITDYRILSENKEDLFEEINFSLFAANKLQKMSSLIREEHFDEAEHQLKTYERIVADVFSKRETKKQLEKFSGRVQRLAKVLESKKKKAQLLKGKKKPKQAKSRPIRKGRSKATGGAKDEESQADDNLMDSDSQEEVLYRQMRARSNSAERNN